MYICTYVHMYMCMYIMYVCIYCKQGCKWHVTSERFGRRWNAGNIIGCYLDLENQTMSEYLLLQWYAIMQPLDEVKNAVG